MSLLAHMPGSVLTSDVRNITAVAGGHKVRVLYEWGVVYADRCIPGNSVVDVAVRDTWLLRSPHKARS